MLDLIGKLRRILSRREKIQAILLMGAMLVGALLEMVGVGAIPAFVSALTNPEAIRTHPAGRRVMDTLGLTTADQVVLAGASALLVLFIVKNTYLAALSWAQGRYVFHRQVGVARRLFAAYLRSPYTFHLQRNTAELLRNTNQDALLVTSQGLMPLLQLVLHTLTVTAILVLLLVVEPATSLAAFIILGGTTAVFLRLVRRRMLKVGEDERRHRGEMLQAVNEGLGGIKVTKVFGREWHFLDSFNDSSQGFAVAGRTRYVLQDLPRLTLETMAVAGLLAVAAVLLAQGRPVPSLIPALALLAVAVVKMIPSFNRITTSLNEVRYGRAAIQGIYEDLATLECAESPKPEPLPFDNSIRLERIDFTYPGANAPSLNNISLEIPKGSAVGFVGPTGAGKTTLVDIILGLLEPSEGRVLIDGQDLRGHERGWQRQIGYIPQDIYLADASIRHNIAFGLSDSAIDEAAVWEAVDSAQVGEFVDRLPDGIDTIIGERGVRLSGGQRQRIGIARALYGDPEVLIMDEATSALDNETEHYVMEAIDYLRGSRTLVLIAHRLSTVETCDRLFLLSDGRVTAYGTYRDLQLNSVEFKRMLSGVNDPS